MTTVIDGTSGSSIAGNGSVVGSLTVGGTATVSGNVVMNGASSGAITLTAPAVAGTNTITLPAGTGTVAVQGVSSNIVSGAVQTASGTSVDFLGIPSWVKRVTVMFNGVSTSGSSIIQLQLGTSSGVETSGYVGTADTWNNTPGPTAWGGTGCVIGDSIASTYSISGVMTLVSIGSNIWVVQSLMGSGILLLASVGTKALSGTLDRVRITTVNGTDTFDAGSINILWE